MAGAGIALGPIVGGWLLERFWYGSVFLVNIPVIAWVLAGIAVAVPTSRDPEAAALDPVGALLSVVGLAALVYAVIEGPSGWTRPQVLAGFGLAAVLLPAFVVWERRIEQPMLRISFFRDPRLSAASVALAFVFFGMLGSLFLLTQYLQFVQSYSPLATGVRLLPLAGTLLLVAPASARLVEHLGARTVIASGLVLAATALTLTATLPVDASYPSIAAVLVVLGSGFGLTLPSTTHAIMSSMPPAKAGVASAVADTTQQLGGALGVAVIGSVFASVFGDQVRGALAQLSLREGIIEAASEQIGAALVAAAAVGGQRGTALAATARHAFVDGMAAGLTVGAIVALLGAALVIAVLPTRPAHVNERPPASARPEPVALADGGRETSDRRDQQ